MRETPFFFDRDAVRLFGIFHEPDPDRPARSPFVFCHPLLEEKLWAHRAMVQFARVLAGKGHPVLRFDCAGYGDSSGDFEAFTAADHLADIHRATAEVRRRAGSHLPVHLLGVRFGATLAALAAEEAQDMGALMLWQPVPSGNEYMQELLRSNLTTQLAVFRSVRNNRQKLVEMIQEGQLVNVEGYGIGRGLYESIVAIDLTAAPRTHRRPVLVADTARNGGAASDRLREFAAGYPMGRYERTPEDPFWKEIRAYCQEPQPLFETSLGWLETVQEGQ